MFVTKPPRRDVTNTQWKDFLARFSKLEADVAVIKATTAEIDDNTDGE